MAREGRDKDQGKDRGKGKEIAPEPAKKKQKTRDEREAKAAERIANAFDAMHSGRVGGIRIGEPHQNPPRAAKPAQIMVDPQPPKGYKSCTKFLPPKR